MLYIDEQQKIFFVLYFDRITSEVSDHSTQATHGI